MSTVSPFARLSDVAPALVLRLGLIVAGMAALVARRFLRDPTFSGLIGPLWSWLNRSVRRFGRVLARPVVAKVAPRDRAVAPQAAKARVRLPAGRGWLVKALGWEAAGYGCQLEALLAEPEMVALLDAVPAVGRVLRPLGRMLGVTVGPVKVVAVVKAAAPEAREVRVRKPRGRRARIPLPGSTRPDSFGPGMPATRPRW